MASFLKLLDQDNLSLDEYAWYAGDMNVDDAKEHLDKLPVGKWQSLSILEIKPSGLGSRILDMDAEWRQTKVQL